MKKLKKGFAIAGMWFCGTNMILWAEVPLDFVFVWLPFELLMAFGLIKSIECYYDLIQEEK